jgi:caffeoyl-CoA O-methyltransferase
VLHDIPSPIAARMKVLEALDADERRQDLPPSERIRAVPPESGRLLALLAATAPAGARIELGTGSGYSTLWLALAARAGGTRVRTFEVREDRAATARETFRVAGVEAEVELVVGDLHARLGRERDIGFCFMDHAKEQYADGFATVVPNLVPGGLLIADNVLSHQDALAPFVEAALADARVDGTVLPVGKGLLLCRRV